MSPILELFAALLITIFLLILSTHAYAGIIGASWVPTKKQDLDRIIAASRGFQGGTIVDLGCGGGSVMRAFSVAYPSARVLGLELSIPAFCICTLRNFFSSQRKQCATMWGDFYKRSLTSADLVYCFLMPHAMAKLKDKFTRELRSGTMVITYSFPVPGWQGEVLQETGRLPIYRYIVP